MQNLDYNKKNLWVDYQLFVDNSHECIPALLHATARQHLPQHDQDTIQPKDLHNFKLV